MQIDLKDMSDELREIRSDFRLGICDSLMNMAEEIAGMVEPHALEELEPETKMALLELRNVFFNKIHSIHHEEQEDMEAGRKKKQKEKASEKLRLRGSEQAMITKLLEEQSSKETKFLDNVKSRQLAEDYKAFVKQKEKEFASRKTKKIVPPRHLPDLNFPMPPSKDHEDLESKETSRSSPSSSRPPSSPSSQEPLPLGDAIDANVPSVVVVADAKRQLSRKQSPRPSTPEERAQIEQTSSQAQATENALAALPDLATPVQFRRALRPFDPEKSLNLRAQMKELRRLEKSQLTDLGRHSSRRNSGRKRSSPRVLPGQM